MRIPHHAVFLLSAALAASGAAASAAGAQSPVTLTFEGLADATQIGSYYNGGAGGALGVVFDTTAYATVAATAGGFGGFQRAPSGTTALFFSSPGTTFVNVFGGFTSSFRTSYSAIAEAGSVSVYSGLGGTGTLLGTLTLGTTASQPGTAACPDADSPYCPFALASLAFAGTARSVVFGGAANQIVFDDLTFGAAPAAVVPEPTTFALAAGGLGVLAAARRRRARA